MLTNFYNVINYCLERTEDMEFKEFIKNINALAEMIQFRQNVSDLIHKLKYMDRDFIGEDSYIMPCDHLIINLMAKLITVQCTDKFKAVKEDIEWWLYDTECGTNKEYAVVTYKDGTEKLIDTPEKLWEYIQTFLSE